LFATPGANNVNLLIDTVILHYMALQGEQGNIANISTKRLGKGGIDGQFYRVVPTVNGVIT
jgi:hypothetical protein